jgi:hypothetical protein
VHLPGWPGIFGPFKAISSPNPRSDALIAHSLTVAAGFLMSIPVAYRIGPDAAN